MSLFDFLVIAKSALRFLSAISIPFLLFVIGMIVLKTEKTINHILKSQTFAINSILDTVKLCKELSGKSQEKPKTEEE